MNFIYLAVFIFVFSDGAIKPIATQVDSIEQCSVLADKITNDIQDDQTIKSAYWKCETIDLDSVDTNSDLNSNPQTDEPDQSGHKL